MRAVLYSDYTAKIWREDKYFEFDKSDFIPVDSNQYD